MLQIESERQDFMRWYLRMNFGKEEKPQEESVEVSETLGWILAATVTNLRVWRSEMRKIFLVDLDHFNRLYYFVSGTRWYT